MNKNEWKKLLGVVGRMLVAYALVFAQGARAAQDQGTKDKAASPQKVAAQQATEKQAAVPARTAAQTKQTQGEESESTLAEAKPSGDGRHEGIKVHGHWTIEVRNPDGSLVTHREFENSLQSSGATFLASLLGGLNNPANSINSTQTVWQVFLQDIQGASSSSPCPGTACVLIQNAATNSLTVTSNAGSLTMTGSLVAANSGVINTVATGLFFFVNSQLNNPTFTQATLTSNPGPVSVSAGQTIAVTVTISFS